MPNLSKIIETIKKAGPNNTRITPIPGTDKFMIEINLGSGWASVMKGLKQQMAEDIVRQASSRIILG